MRTSQYLLSTTKETPADAEVASHRLMLRAGMIRRLAAGLYTWLPLGLRVLHKVEAIVRAEMDAAGAQEVLMPAIQPAELWQESGRWEQYGPELLRLKDRHERDFCFGPTHEEVITDLVRREIKSYRQLPANFYQIQTKFRDEIRPRFGIMRAREFLMKDAYSFHLTAQSLQETYERMHQTYSRIFTRLGLQFRAVEADVGAIGGHASHEFHVLADSGEDAIVICDSCGYAANLELAQAVAGDRCPKTPCAGRLTLRRGIEVGHIFQLGTKYSAAMKATCLDESGKAVTMPMGCYGIGVSRVVAAAIEQNHDANGIIWPDPIAPFDVCLVPIGLNKSPEVARTAELIYKNLIEGGFEVVFDDRDERPGVMFADMDLIGVPHRLVIGERGLKHGKVEYKGRRDGTNLEWPVQSVVANLRAISTQKS